MISIPYRKNVRENGTTLLLVATATNRLVVACLTLLSARPIGHVAAEAIIISGLHKVGVRSNDPLHNIVLLHFHSLPFMSPPQQSRSLPSLQFTGRLQGSNNSASGHPDRFKLPGVQLPVESERIKTGQQIVSTSAPIPSTYNHFSSFP